MFAIQKGNTKDLSHLTGLQCTDHAILQKFRTRKQISRPEINDWHFPCQQYRSRNISGVHGFLSFLSKCRYSIVEGLRSCELIPPTCFVLFTWGFLDGFPSRSSLPRCNMVLSSKYTAYGPAFCYRFPDSRVYRLNKRAEGYPLSRNGQKCN